VSITENDPADRNPCFRRIVEITDEDETILMMVVLEKKATKLVWQSCRPCGPPPDQGMLSRCSSKYTTSGSVHGDSRSAEQARDLDEQISALRRPRELCTE
jgi:hypothetical protein